MPSSQAVSQNAALLAVQAAELRSLKPGRKVYVKTGNLFYLSTRDEALAATAALAAAAGQ